ncbi:MAG: hypothetical protein AAF205_08810, partial [Pseudomonadota bacterium]
MLRFVIAACAVTLASATPATANVADGVEKWRSGQYKEAVMLWLPPAARGDAHALFNLGLAARQGRGLPKDLARAEDFFRRAAAKGHNPARTYLGIFLARRGEDAKAIDLWRESAAAGDAHARYMLGIRLFNGDTIARDWPRAYAYMLLARNTGLRQATKALTRMDANMPPADRERGRAIADQILNGTAGSENVELAEAIVDGKTDTSGAAVTDTQEDPVPAITDDSPPRIAAAVRAAEIRDAGETTETGDRAAVETPIEIQAPPVPQAEPPADGPRRHRVQLA